MDIKAIIEKLQNIDVKDLKDLKNLKNIDVSQIKEKLQSRPDLLINLVLIITTLFAVFYTYKKNTTEAKMLKAEVGQLEQRMVVVEQGDRSQEEYDNFLTSFPESLPSDQIINKLSEFAGIHNIQILSFSPANAREENFTEQTTVQLNISSESYVDIVRFIKAIEDSPFSIRVDKFTSTTRSNPRQTRQQVDISQATIIEAKIEIASITLKE